MKKIILVILVFIISQTAFAQGKTTSLSLSEAINLGMQKNIELQAKRKDFEKAQLDIKLTNKLKNPQFHSNFLVGKVSSSNASQFGLSLPIEVLKRGKRVEKAKIQSKMTELEIIDFEYNLKLDITKAYYNVLIEKATLQIMNERAELLQDLYEIAQKRSKKLQDYESDLLQADIKYKRQLILIEKTKSNLKMAQYRLNKVLNVGDAETFYDIKDESLLATDNCFIMEPPPLEKLVENTLENRYDLLVSKNEIEKNKTELDIAISKRIPDLTINGGYAYMTAKQTGSAALPGAYIGASTDIPVLDFYTDDIRKAKNTIEQSQIQYNSKVNKTVIAINDAYEKFSVARKNLKQYQEIMKESSQLLAIVKKDYKAGKATQAKLILAEFAHRDIINETLLATDHCFSCYIELLKETRLTTFTAQESL